MTDTSFEIRLLSGDAEARACAEIMSTTDPWITLGRTFDRCLAVVTDGGAETHVALHDGEVVGFAVVMMRGAFVGYIRTLAVRADWRSRGLGARLIEHAEQRIFRETPNVFICVSSFNPRARALYERLGYRVVGELTDYVVRGHSEWMLRKSIGPMNEFFRPGPEGREAGRVS
jgi:[ribosomal protein S18]-alanine N-acetyltransferase